MMKRRSSTPLVFNFDQGCKCINHHIITENNDENDTKALSIKSSKIFKSEVINRMRKSSILSLKTDKLCCRCHAHYVKLYLPSSNTDAANNEECALEDVHTVCGDEDHVKSHLMFLIEKLRTCDRDYLLDGKELLWKELETLINEKIQTDPISNSLVSLTYYLSSKPLTELLTNRVTSWEKLVFLIAKVFCRDQIYNDGRKIKNHYKNTDFLKDMEVLAYIKERNKIMIQFFLGLSGIQLDKESNKIRYSFALLLELCYYFRDLTLVLPFSFLGNLVQSCISGSKTVTMVNGKTAPTGGYSTYKRWIEDKGSLPLVCMNGTIDIFIDNIGKYVIKSYRISSTKTKSADVITTGIQIGLEDPENLQNTSDFIMDRESLNLKNIHDKMRNEISLAHQSFRKYRFYFLQHILHMVLNEENKIDERVAEYENKLVKICSNDQCKRLYKSLKRKCDICKSEVVRLQENSDVKISATSIDTDELANNVGQQKDNEIHPDVKMANPILLNPNSFTNIERILDATKEFANIPNDRKWVFLGCDGPPYIIASKIIQRNPDEYNCFAMLPGLGHLHMNQQKSIIKILEDIILEPLAREVLHFESAKAYKFFMDAKDTHKSWQALQVLLIGCSLEFVCQYINESSDKNNVSVTGFLEWQSSHFNSNIKLLGQLILNFVLAAYLYKIGVRYNDAELINASRLKFMDLFFGFNHPIYREVEYRDLKNRVLYPPEIRKLRDRNMSYSTSSVPGKSKGGDFMLEEKVKRQKLIAPKGPIKAAMWQTISRSLDNFDEIYSAASSYLNLTDPDFAPIKDISKEIFEWRAVLRKSMYFSRSNFTGVPQNIYGDYLADDMINFSFNLVKKREEYFRYLESSGNSTFPSLKNLVVIRGKEMEDMLYVGAESDDNL